MKVLDYLARRRSPTDADLGDPRDDQASSSVAAISLRHVGLTFEAPGGATHAVLRNVNLDVQTGRFVSIVGPSGCGKSTLLNVVAGLASASEGDVMVEGRPIDGPRSGLGYLFQRDALLPWKTVFDNVALGLRFHRFGRHEVSERAQHWIERVGLHGFGQHFPAQLSGGMRKRAALAQVLAVEPKLLLMDEPFSALDVQTRRLMEEDLLSICRGDAGLTVLFVTHDLDEAISLSDEVVVMTAGPASTIKATYPIELGWPRSIADVPTLPGYQELYTGIWHELRKEVQPFYAGKPVHYYAI